MTWKDVQDISRCDVSKVLNVLAEFGLASGASVMCHEVAAICPGDYWSQSEGHEEQT